MDTIKQLPPDPEGMNDSRAEWARYAVHGFIHLTGTDEGDALADLLCDMMHMCDRNGDDFEAMLSRARRNYEAETQDEGEGV